MSVRSQEFAAICAETYTTIRGVYGRPGRAPRTPGPGGVDFARGSHRRYVFADALAWRVTRDLTALGLAWDDAAPLVFRSLVSSWMEKDVLRTLQSYFAVWTVMKDGKTEMAFHHGQLDEIIEMIESDKMGAEVSQIRMIGLGRSLMVAQQLAEDAGYRIESGEFVALADGERGEV